MKLAWISFLGMYSLSVIAMTNSNIPTGPSLTHHNFVMFQSYQDQIVNGKIIFPGYAKKPLERYEAIRNIVKEYKRPFTMLDIGAAQGYFSFKLGHEFKDSTFVLLEEDKYLLKLCMLNTELDNIVFLNKRISIEEMENVSKCEHFDVVLALNVIHWSEARWQEMTDAVLALGDKIIIQTPPAGDNAIGGRWLGMIEKYLEDKGAKIILKTPRHTGTGLYANMYYLEMNKTELKKPDWNREKGNNIYTVRSDIFEKLFIKTFADGKKKVHPWVPGINMLTFNNLNGVYPLQETLDKLGVKRESNNEIVQGNRVRAIGH